MFWSVGPFWYMVYGIWYVVYGIWYVVYGMIMAFTVYSHGVGGKNMPVTKHKQSWSLFIIGLD